MAQENSIYAIPSDSILNISMPKDSGLVLRKVIRGDIRPKSIVHSGDGRFFAQNMMYRHTITVYDRDMELVKTISDRIKLEDYGYKGYKGYHKGAPVEAVFTHNGQYAWVSNYEMQGEGFDNPGADACTISNKYDQSYVYQIDTRSLEIISAIEVGCVPKYLAATPNHKYVLVSNWCSGDLSVIDTNTKKEIKRITLGRYPRGIAVDEKGEKAYVAIMGSNKIAVIHLFDFSVSWLKDIGRRPRHLCIDSHQNFLYATLNSEGKVIKIDLFSGEVIKKTNTGTAPRSMVMTEDGAYLYVVNYFDESMSKVRSSDMKVVQTVKTHKKPIGITYDKETRNVWVACYPGSIMVFKDTNLPEWNKDFKKENPIFIAHGPFLPSWKELQIRLEKEVPFFAYIPSEELQLGSLTNIDESPLLASIDSIPLIAELDTSKMGHMEITDAFPLMPDTGPFLPKWQDTLLSLSTLNFDYIERQLLASFNDRSTDSIISDSLLFAEADDKSESNSVVREVEIPTSKLEEANTITNLSEDVEKWDTSSMIEHPNNDSLIAMSAPNSDEIINTLEGSDQAIVVENISSLNAQDQNLPEKKSKSEVSRFIDMNLGPFPPTWDSVMMKFAYLDTLKPEDAFVGAEELFLSDPTEEEVDADFFQPQQPDLTHGYQLIIGSFSSRANANQEVKNFTIRGFLPIVIKAKEATYRVSIMSFDNYEEATARKKRLLDEAKIASWVLKYRN